MDRVDSADRTPGLCASRPSIATVRQGHMLRTAPVWSSAFRRFGAFTTLCRVNAELRT